METINLTTIKKEVLVNASQETAFKVFTGRMDAWWPKTHHVGKCPMVESVLEQKQSGRWFSRHEDGSEVEIGHILKWEPYGQVILAWQIDGNFQYDPALITEVEVNFIAEGPKTTRVVMEHRDLQKLGGGAKVVGDMDNGWGMILNLYKVVADEA
ncbi:SRPBCC family protein [Mucilaginibacter ximonensis]|uniref:SRPBCC family protein n=1 Tax=Mucilaginibacter ximonensis TaxID=538021 RepID=A0ABW5Y9I7_9SPHI